MRWGAGAQSPDAVRNEDFRSRPRGRNWTKLQAKKPFNSRPPNGFRTFPGLSGSSPGFCCSRGAGLYNGRCWRLRTDFAPAANSRLSSGFHDAAPRESSANHCALCQCNPAGIDPGGIGVARPSFGPMAQAQPVPMAGGNGMYVMPAQFLPQLWGCYILDTNNQSLTAYAYYGSLTKPQLRLIGARNIQWDRELRNFNTDPDPQHIRELIEVQRAPMRENRPPKTGLTEPKTQPAGDNQ